MIRRMIARVLRLSGRYKGRIQGAFVFSVFNVIFSKMPICYAMITVYWLSQGQMTVRMAGGIAVAMVVTLVLQMLCQHASDRLQSGAGYMLFADKRLALGDHLKRLPMGYFSAGNIGRISSVLSTDMLFVEENVMQKLATIMTYILSAVVLLVFLFVLSPVLGLIVLVTTLAAFAVAGGMNRVSQRSAVARQAQSERLTETVLEFVRGIAVIKSCNLVGEQSDLLRSSFRDSRDQAIAFEKNILPWMMGLGTLYGLGTAGVFAAGLWAYMNDGLSLLYLLGMLLFVLEIFGPLKALFAESSNLAIMDSCLDRIDALFAEPELCDGARTTFPDDWQGPVVEYRHVGFSYGEGEVLHDVSFAMQPKTMTALVGSSGSGKSTVANLLPRFWDVSDGAVLVGGVDVRALSFSTLMDQVSMVFQNVYLFNDTIANNIAMAKPDATEEEIVRAAKKARCFDFIMALPEGFQTMVGEGGANLSGGEKQRISIARSILKDAPIVILDEATASVDSDNERHIQEAIDALVRGKVLLVIAHRLRTIERADQILVLDDGHIVERGTHQQLLAQNGLYADLYRKTTGQTGGKEEK